MSQMQKGNKAANSQDNRLTAARCGNDPMHSVQLHDSCTGRSMITVLMGIPGAGKSTWVRNNKTGFEHVFNTEAIRINRELDMAAFMNLQRHKAILAVESGKDLIADGTHTIKAHRQVWLNLAERLGIETKLVVFNTQLHICMEVQKEREFPAPMKVVRDHHHRLQLAKLQIKREGWGSIEIITR
jgi:predicted kinase